MSDIKTAIIIPARLASTRFPRKPLHKLAGKEMIRHVYERCCENRLADLVAVACESEEIARVIKDIGGKVIMTNEHCASGTDRAREAAESLGAEFRFVVNVQGDEPLLESSVVDAVIQGLHNNYKIGIVTPVSPILDARDLKDSGVVKVVRDNDDNAMFFSRTAIPFVRGASEIPDESWLAKSSFWKHIGIYGFRRDVLGAIKDLPESNLESAESLEQLRWLQAGFHIRTVAVNYDSVAVDTAEDALRVEALMAKADRRTA